MLYNNSYVQELILIEYSDDHQWMSVEYFSIQESISVDYSNIKVQMWMILKQSYSVQVRVDIWKERPDAQVPSLWPGRDGQQRHWADGVQRDAHHLSRIQGLCARSSDDAISDWGLLEMLWFKLKANLLGG